jgi:RNA polymerase sigma factor (sigma-70 family)
MNVQISYKANKTPDVEREFQHQIEKLQRRLQVFKPDLVYFHAMVEPENGHSVKATLNLRLPSGQMAAEKSGESVLAAIKPAFADLLSQVKKHKEQLRGEWRKRRWSPGKREITGGVELKQKVATVKGGVKPAEAPSQTAGDNGDISHWIDANLPRLEKFVERELRYRVATGQIREDQISREEVIDEVMVSALSGEEEKPDELSMESWLYRLALSAIRRLAQANADTANVSLDAPAGVQNVTGSDENVLQYHQPDDSLPEESVIPDQNVRTPEEIVSSEEMAAQLDSVLHKVSAQDREAFVLFALEGFTVEEIARITDLPPEGIRKCIERARERVQKDLPPQNDLREKLLRHSRVA